jgi:hypothetical protein
MAVDTPGRVAKEGYASISRRFTYMPNATQSTTAAASGDAWLQMKSRGAQFAMSM